MVMPLKYGDKRQQNEGVTSIIEINSCRFSKSNKFLFLKWIALPE